MLPIGHLCVFLEHMALRSRHFWKVMQRLVKRQTCFVKRLEFNVKSITGRAILVHVAVLNVYFENEKVRVCIT